MDWHNLTLIEIIKFTTIYINFNDLLSEISSLALFFKFQITKNSCFKVFLP